MTIRQQKGADVKLGDNQNSTPLHKAVSQEDVPLHVVSQLIPPQNINMQDRYGSTARAYVV